MSTFALLISIFQFLISPSPALASTADLSINQSSISFSGDLISGSTVRVYAQVNNVGDVDVDGYVTFYQGSAVIGESLIISVRADGAPEEVYVDFVVPDAAFNIRAEIRGTDPKDGNSSNDSALTKLYAPVLDEDGDGVQDASDNCVDASNSNQKDTDGDGFGNACDDDDDGDGATDDVEKENGSDTLVTDTDGDGVSDAKDAYPTDKTRSKVAAAAPTPVAAVPVVVPASSSATASEDKPAPKPVAAPVTEVAPIVEPVPEPATLPGTAAVTETPAAATHAPVPLGFSPNAIFQHARSAWNAFSFAAIVPDGNGYQYQWDFGDGVTSSRSEVQHTYVTSGDFDVTFSVTDSSGVTSRDSTLIHVPFWTLQNRVVLVLLGFLSFLLLIGLGMIARLSRLSKVVAHTYALARASEDENAHGGHITTVGEDDEALDRPKSKKLHVRNLDD